MGLVGRILDGLPTTDMGPNRELGLAHRGLTNDPARLYIACREHGGSMWLHPHVAPVPHAYRVVDPQTGETVAEGRWEDGKPLIPDPGGAPRVHICFEG
ncbi:hypothetical protein [Streptomyces sp. R35]|uniref:Uncharacterized protein n=1 Tax=Streptomyces sp. R35 TaxID=3238630 RepID=A0AB39SES7_9ACTN